MFVFQNKYDFFILFVPRAGKRGKFGAHNSDLSVILTRACEAKKRQAEFEKSSFPASNI